MRFLTFRTYESTDYDAPDIQRQLNMYDAKVQGDAVISATEVAANLRALTQEGNPCALLVLDADINNAGKSRYLPCSIPLFYSYRLSATLVNGKSPNIPWGWSQTFREYSVTSLAIPIFYLFCQKVAFIPL
jgi:hypothetical protein